MSAETFVFTQLQSGALPTELSEANPPTCLHYLTLIKEEGEKSHPIESAEARGFQGLKPKQGLPWLVQETRSQNRHLCLGREGRG